MAMAGASRRFSAIWSCQSAPWIRRSAYANELMWAKRIADLWEI
jgi:hypothetical protein